MNRPTLALTIDRNARISIAEQIRQGITEAIESGVLAPGTRLPSWIDLAIQLGISRGTVKTAYERLSDEQLVVMSRSRGTCVVDNLPPGRTAKKVPESVPTSELFQDFLFPTGDFQMGIPAGDVFPVPLFSRLFAASARHAVQSRQCYGDPRGESELRREIAGQLTLSRGIKCHPSQVFVTAGFTGGLGLILHALSLRGHKAWVENPGFPPARKALSLAGLATVPVRVDSEGMDIEYGIHHAPDAAIALVTPGQQAPLGMALSLERRHRLIEWAHQNGRWIIEDDYLGELQLNRRAAPALASQDIYGRVIHIGSFSKTISPALRLGFVVAPPSLVETVADVAASLSPAPTPAIQMAVHAFLSEGHFLRHLRKMKRVYHARSTELSRIMKALGYTVQVHGLSVLINLPDGSQDRTIAHYAYNFGLAPSPLSAWYQSGVAEKSGLLLGVSGKEGESLLYACERLDRLIRKLA
ncbi:TPA: PLP-dependent aminotransferase family protein [Serratia marcescens]|uniref:MocR-like pyridoxine biosynthesis transcription factor PdxR n=1 Tax=Serratia marcescens TaxID=615 RepID=UPI000B5FF605|nr:PLP-dependent aminotransferase family protein [Serratia marcescens]ASM16815.1 GntR family transcriptional regulator [Serratia marcescens]MBY4848139.1 PLP-dependent aminotransferase family protein [Serratia marcescens]MCH9866146.1 PLP-dependent aminotransferase family protein [Serratia marcescens]